MRAERSGISASWIQEVLRRIGRRRQLRSWYGSLRLRREMEGERHFLVIDDNADARRLLVRTLLRKFPRAQVTECPDGETALRLAASESYDAIISHRAAEMDGVTLIRELRGVNSRVPILMVSGIDRTEPGLAAGATRFLNYDEWLRLGTVVAEIIRE